MIEALPVRVAPSMAGEATEKKKKMTLITVKFVNFCTFYCFKFIKPVVSFVSNSDKFDDEDRTKTN